MSLYVAFDDSANDPTYVDIEAAYIVDSDNESDHNPCTGEGAIWIPVLPRTVTDVQDFAAIMGWTVEVTKEGQIVLHTDVCMPTVQ